MDQLFGLFREHPKTMIAFTLTVLGGVGVFLVAGRALVRKVQGDYYGTALTQLEDRLKRQDQRIEEFADRIVALETEKLDAVMRATQSASRAEAAEERAKHAEAEVRKLRDKVTALRNRVAELEKRKDNDRRD